MLKPARLTATEGIEATLAFQGRTVTWLAGRIGKSRKTTTWIVKRQCTVDQETAQRIADALGVPIELLFTGLE